MCCGATLLVKLDVTTLVVIFSHPMLVLMPQKNSNQQIVLYLIAVHSSTVMSVISTPRGYVHVLTTVLLDVF